MHWNSWKKSIYSKPLRNSCILNKWRRRSLRHLVVKRGFLFSIFHFCIFHFCFFYVYHFLLFFYAVYAILIWRIEYFYKPAVVNFSDSRKKRVMQRNCATQLKRQPVNSNLLRNTKKRTSHCGCPLFSFITSIARKACGISFKHPA